MVRERAELTHQREGTVGNLVGLESSGTDSLQAGSGNICRQHNSPSIYCQTRGHLVMEPLFTGKRNPPLVRGEGGSSDPSVYQRHSECDSQLLKQKEPDHSNRVDSSHGSVQTTVEDMGSAMCGSVRNVPKLSDSGIHVTTPGQPSSSSRLNVATMVQYGSLRIPALCHDQGSSKQNKVLKKLQGDIGRSMVASSGVVPRSHRASSRHSKKSTPTKRSLEATSGRSSSSKPPHASSDRMETLFRLVRSRGFCSENAQQMFRSKRSTTNRLYQQRWSIYFSWCQSKGVSSTRTTVNNICSFLCFLWYEKKYAVSTIKGFRSMLVSVLRHLGMDLSHDKDINEIIKSFEVEVPRRPTVI